MTGEVSALLAVLHALYELLQWLRTAPSDEIVAVLWRYIWISLYVFGWLIVCRYLWTWAFGRRTKK